MAIDISTSAFIFSAGFLALFSPCGFPMLPGYVGYYLGTKTNLKNAGVGSIACSLGLLTVFSMIGVAASLVRNLVNAYVWALELLAGIITIFMGLALLTELKSQWFIIPVKAPEQKGLLGLFFYGIVYGLATISCASPIFFSILFYAFAAGGAVEAFVTFVIYALGMGFPLILITITVSKARHWLLKRIVELIPLIRRLSGLLLIFIGAYLIYYYIVQVGL
ncbi:MAG: cytochrome c biogenesis CcdA family protein [Candidatus Heimdallarchaeota archaeon]